jgi:hypothetical protein
VKPNLPHSGLSRRALLAAVAAVPALPQLLLPARTGNGESTRFGKDAIHMTRIVPIAVGLAFLLTNYAWAQSNCGQIRAAVAKYGYASARRHAMIHYGAAAVKEGDKCLRKRGRSTKRHVKHAA